MMEKQHTLPADISNNYYHIQNANCQLGSTFVAKPNLKVCVWKWKEIQLHCDCYYFCQIHHDGQYLYINLKTEEKRNYSYSFNSACAIVHISSYLIESRSTNDFVPSLMSEAHFIIT
jgi:hypothetical protein